MISTRIPTAHGRQDPTEDRAAVMTEYGLLIALVFIVAIVAVSLYGDAVVGLFTDSDEEFADVRPQFPAEGDS